MKTNACSSLRAPQPGRQVDVGQVSWKSGFEVKKAHGKELVSSQFLFLSIDTFFKGFPLISPQQRLQHSGAGRDKGHTVLKMLRSSSRIAESYSVIPQSSAKAHHQEQAYKSSLRENINDGVNRCGH